MKRPSNTTKIRARPYRESRLLDARKFEHVILLDLISGGIYFVLSTQFIRFDNPHFYIAILGNGIIGILLLMRSKLPAVTLTLVVLLTFTLVTWKLSNEPMVGAGWALATFVASQPPKRGRRTTITLTILTLFLSLTAGGTPSSDFNIGQWLVLSLLSIATGITVGTYAATLKEEARQRVALQAAVNARDERIRIAQHLHDLTSRTFVAIGTQAGVAALIKSAPEDLRQTLLTVEKQSKDAAEEIRYMLQALRDDSDDIQPPVPLSERIKNIIDSAQAVGVQCDANITLHREINRKAENTICEILFELLTNVAKHTETKEAKVTIFVHAETNHITLIVEDNGTAPRMKMSKSGFGLLGISERVDTLGGSFTMHPTSNNGTRVSVTLPTQTEQELT